MGLPDFAFAPPARVEPSSLARGARRAERQRRGSLFRSGWGGQGGGWVVRPGHPAGVGGSKFGEGSGILILIDTHFLACELLQSIPFT